MSPTKKKQQQHTSCVYMLTPPVLKNKRVLYILKWKGRPGGGGGGEHIYIYIYIYFCTYESLYVKSHVKGSSDVWIWLPGDESRAAGRKCRKRLTGHRTRVTQTGTNRGMFRTTKRVSYHFSLVCDSVIQDPKIIRRKCTLYVVANPMNPRIPAIQ